MISVSSANNLCLNCSTDLDTDTSGNNNNSSAFYTLNCSSRVRSPFSPTTVELIPVNHALATVFNFETLAKVSNTKSRSNVNGKGKEKKNPLTDFQSSTCNVPICFSCYLVLSDLYRVYTEFNQLRKANSFLGSKLKKLEEELRLQGQGQAEDEKANSNAPVPSTSDMTQPGLLPIVNNHVHSQVNPKGHAVTQPPFCNQIITPDETEEGLTDLDFVKPEVYEDEEENDDESEMDLDDNIGGVTEDEERDGGEQEDESQDMDPLSTQVGLNAGQATTNNQPLRSVVNVDSSASTSVTSENQALTSVIEEALNEDLVAKRICDAYKLTGQLDAKDVTVIVNTAVSKFIDLRETINISTTDQKNLAKSLISLFPVLKYTKSSDGLDNLYDSKNRNGKIQMRLRLIHQKKSPKVSLKGMKPSKIQKVSDRSFDEDYMNLLIDELNATVSSEREKILKLMKDSFSHRVDLRINNPNAILSKYKKFLDFPGLIDFDFELAFLDFDTRGFNKKWVQWSTAILQYIQQAKKTKAVSSALRSILETWDTSVSAIFALLLLIPPAPQGKGRTSRLSATSAQNCILRFHKNGTPLTTIVANLPEDLNTPVLIGIGESPKLIDSFWLVVDKKLIPISREVSICEAQDDFSYNSGLALATFFKSHLVFNRKYDHNLIGAMTFLQYFVFEVQVEDIVPSRKVKEIYTQVSLLMSKMVTN